MTCSRAVDLAAAFVTALLASSVASAGEQWDPNNRQHQAALQGWTQNESVFETSGNGLVRRSNASPDSLYEHLRRQGIDIGPGDATTVVTHADLSLKGKNPKSVPLGKLTKAWSPGNTGLHGHLAEIDLMKSNDKFAYSYEGSKSVDLTERGPDGKVKAYAQSKAMSTPGESLSGAVDNYVKHHQESWPGKFDAEFHAYLPKDQVEHLEASGVIDQDGRVKDPARMQEELDRVMKGAPSRGSENRKALESGMEHIEKPGTKKATLVIKSLPETYGTYRQRAQRHEAASHGPKSPLIPAGAKAGKFVAGAGAGLAVVGLAQAIRGGGSFAQKGVSITQAALGVAELSQTYNGRAKQSVQRLLKRLPDWASVKVPKVETVRALGKWAVRGGAFIAAAMVAWDASQFARGRMTTRAFSGSLAGTAGALAGAFLGGNFGAAAGAATGPFALICVPVFTCVGFLTGGVIGYWIPAKVNDAIWDSWDAAERKYALDLLRERIRLQVNP